MKISYVMNVLNGEPFIKYQLDSIYKHAHEIIIVEGAYKKFAHATINGRSKDSTISTIQNYPDIENKIKLIVNDDFYEDRKEMCDEFLKYVTGDVIWQVDADEFYFDETHMYIKSLFENDPELDLVSFNFKDYYKNLNYYIVGYETLGLNNVNRVHRFNGESSWFSQRPPVLMNNDEKKIIRKKIDGYTLELLGHIMHHATLIFEAQIQDKYKYYSSMWGSVNEPTQWYIDTWENFDNKLNIAGFRNHITFLEKNENDVPIALNQMFEDVKSDFLIEFKLSDDTKIRECISKKEYGKYVEIALSINSLATDKFIKAILNCLFLYGRTFLIIDNKTAVFARAVIVKKVLSKVNSHHKCTTKFN